MTSSLLLEEIATKLRNEVLKTTQCKPIHSITRFEVPSSMIVVVANPKVVKTKGSGKGGCWQRIWKDSSLDVKVLSQRDDHAQNVAKKTIIGVAASLTLLSEFDFPTMQ